MINLIIGELWNFEGFDVAKTHQAAGAVVSDVGEYDVVEVDEAPTLLPVGESHASKSMEYNKQTNHLIFFNSLNANISSLASDKFFLR